MTNCAAFLLLFYGMVMDLAYSVVETELLKFHVFHPDFGLLDKFPA